MYLRTGGRRALNGRGNCCVKNLGKEDLVHWSTEMQRGRGGRVERLGLQTGGVIYNNSL